MARKYADTATVDSKVASVASGGGGEGGPDLVAQSMATSASVRASVADSKAVSDSVVESGNKSVADSKATSLSVLASIADSKGVSAGTLAAAGSTSTSTADSKGVSASTRASVADSKAVSNSLTTSTADSKAVAADSRALSVSLNTSSADSKAVSAGAGGGGSDSVAQSMATSAAVIGTTADSKGVSSGTRASVADSKALSVSGNTSVADSKAVSAAAGGGSGSDPWTYVALAADFTTSLATAQNVTGLEFTPVANTRYIFEAVLGVRSATATVNPRPGLAWATGMADGVATIEQTSTATAKLMVNGNIAAPLLLAVGGIPNNSASFPALCYGFVRAGATPSGNIRIQLASETAGTVVRIVASSYLRYRTY